MAVIAGKSTPAHTDSTLYTNFCRCCVYNIITDLWRHACLGKSRCCSKYRKALPDTSASLEGCSRAASLQHACTSCHRTRWIVSSYTAFGLSYPTQTQQKGIQMELAAVATCTCKLCYPSSWHAHVYRSCVHGSTHARMHANGGGGGYGGCGSLVCSSMVSSGQNDDDDDVPNPARFLSSSAAGSCCSNLSRNDAHSAKLRSPNDTCFRPPETVVVPSSTPSPSGEGCTGKEEGSRRGWTESCTCLHSSSNVLSPSC